MSEHRITMKSLFFLIILLGCYPTPASGQASFAPIAYQLDRYLKDLNGLSGEAIVTSSTLLPIAVAPDGEQFRDARSFNKDHINFRWDCQVGWIAIDSKAMIPTSVKTADGLKAWSFSGAESYNVQARFGPDGRVFMDSVLYGPNVKGWPTKVVLPPLTTRICYVTDPKSRGSLTSQDLRAIFSFGNAPPPYIQWPDFIRPLDETVSLGLATLEMRESTDKIGDKILRLIVSSTKTNDVLDFSFYVEKGFLPYEFVDFRDNLTAIKQQWSWHFDGSRWMPASYIWSSDKIVDSGGGRAEWLFENVQSKADGEYGISSLAYKKYDRVFDRINNILYVHDGSELVEWDSFREGDRKGSFGYLLLWFAIISTSLVLLIRQSMRTKRQA